MQAQCSAGPLEFRGFQGRRVVGAFDAPQSSSDGGLLLLRELEERRGWLGRFARCFRDFRSPELIRHSVESLIRQRVLALCCGYEDLNDPDALRDDALLSLSCGRRPKQRLASRSTLNRLECTPAQVEPRARYHKIAYDEAALERLWVERFLEREGTAPPRIVLDLDATDDPLHGTQEGRFFHGYYRSYCSLPLYIFCGNALLCAQLQRSNIDASAGALEQVQRIVAQIRERWPEVPIWLRADSGFAREERMAWCETHRVEYVFGLARNARLESLLSPAMDQAIQEQQRTGEASVRHYEELLYRTQKTWTRTRRVVGKAERLGTKSNPRFVVTSLDPKDFPARMLYADLYCARGDMENRIKEQQLELFADRTRSHTTRANQLRLWLSSLAYVMLVELRRALAGTALGKAQAGTLRVRLLKIAAFVRISVRRIVVSLSDALPLQHLFAEALARLRERPA